MGKLIRLELFNFKSYKGHHVLLFGDSYFTSIIGPNGSGKSNSMDAISFVLGIKSSHLRSSQLKDLIYRGRVLKTSKITADGDAVEVEQGAEEPESHTQDPDDLADDDGQSRSQRHDPHTAWVMAVYEDDTGEEQTWKRSITASGSSEYRINGRSVSAKQYNEALEEENILIKARNFLVFQGDVEAIANQNPRDLTRLIEQISGSGEYRADYERLKAEAEKAAEEQTYMLQQRRGINQEIKQYQDQKRETEAFNAKEAERDNAVVEHIVWKLFNYQNTLDSARPAMQENRDKLREHHRQVSALESALEDARRKQAESARRLVEAERALKRADHEIGEMENSQLPIRERLIVARRNVERHSNKHRELERERQSAQEHIDRLQRNRDTVAKAFEQWKRQWAAEQEQLGQTLSDNDLHEYNTLKAEVGTRTAIAQDKVDKIARLVKFLQEEKNSSEEDVRRISQSLENLNSNLGVFENNRASVAARLERFQNELDSKTQTLRELDSDRIRIAHARTELDEKLQDVLKKLTEADIGRRESEREIRMKETVASLKRIYPGVKGRVSDLCRPKQRRFETAVTTVIARNLDSIVVDTEKTAKECINYLREQRSGQATFIPLDTIAVMAGNAAIKGLMEGVRLAIDTIEFDSSVERAMLYVCADAVICNDLATAKEIRFQRKLDVKAVALDGTVIHRAGLMTGGRTAEGATRRRWEATEVDTLHKLREKLMGELAALPLRPTAGTGDEAGMDEEQLKADISRVSSEMRYVQKELDSYDHRIESSRSSISQYTRELESITANLETTKQSLDQREEELLEARQEIIVVEDDVFADFCAKHGFDDIRQYEEQQGSVQQRASGEKLRFTTQLSTVNNQLTYENSRMDSLKDRMRRLSDLMSSDETAVAATERELEDAEKVLNDMVGRRDGELTEAVEAAQQNNEKRAQTTARRRADLAEAGTAVDEIVKSLETIEAEARRMSAARYGLLRKCKIEKIDLPLVQGSQPLSKLPLDEIPNGESQTTGEDDRMDVDGDDDDDDDGAGASGRAQADVFETHGIEIDFSVLDEDVRQDGDEIERQYQDKIATLVSELEQMAPNVRATNRLDEVESRLSKTERDFENARRAAKDAREQFEATKAKRLELFNNAFTHISERIGPVYKDLTRSDAFPLGGQAYLDSEDSEEPYLAGLKYHAMPPLKRFRDMEHLSGGEKTMAALALLFSIHSFQPSPFFVLDEVDAALDNANVGKIARYIAEHAGPGMQFIVISLKLGLFCQSEALVGVMRDQGKNSSMALTLDLRKYSREGGQRAVPGVVTGFAGL